MRGKIIKGVGGFYTVLTEENHRVTGGIKGIFRNQNIVPMVGDNVIVQKEKDGSFVIAQILERKNALLRPAVANVTQMIIVAACTRPKPNLMMLDKLIASYEQIGLKIIMCFNKVDIAKKADVEHLKQIYGKTSYELFFVSAKEAKLGGLKKHLYHETTVLAGPSGAGKSTLLNAIHPAFFLRTGKVSEKIGRGRHTTRHVELLCLDETSYIVDTPGFTNIDLTDMEIEKVDELFVEFRPYLGKCKFTSCAHDSEPECAVKEALQEGKISGSRYRNYLVIKDEIDEKLRKNWR